MLSVSADGLVIGHECAVRRHALHPRVLVLAGGDHIPKVRLYREPRRRIRFLTRVEARRLLQELPSHLREMAKFPLMTGLRQRNVSYLRWDQVDMARGVAWIHPDEAKAGRAIGVPLNADALEVLRRRRGEHPEYVFT